jgi:hypothetical protein
MLLNAPTCPECESRDTKWLPTTSDGAFVDYFRCFRCATVWVVGQTPGDSRQVTPSHKRAQSGVMFLFVDIEAGLLFATMAQSTHDHDRRQQLHRKAQTVLDAVSRFLPRVRMSDDERDRVTHGLNALRTEIGKIRAAGVA